MNHLEIEKQINNSTYILGLDVSTTTIGICLYNMTTDSITQITHLTPKLPKNTPNLQSLLLKSNLFGEYLHTIKKLNIKTVVIEEPLLRSNNVNTVSVLLRYNGMITQLVHQILNVIPEFISSYDARKYAFPELMDFRRYTKKGELVPQKKYDKSVLNGDKVLFGGYPFDVDKKYIIWNKVSEKFPDVKWVYNKKGELIKECFDGSDAVTCILGYMNKIKIC